MCRSAERMQGAGVVAMVALLVMIGYCTLVDGRRQIAAVAPTTAAAATRQALDALATAAAKAHAIHRRMLLLREGKQGHIMHTGVCTVGGAERRFLWLHPLLRIFEGQRDERVGERQAAAEAAHHEGVHQPLVESHAKRQE